VLRARSCVLERLEICDAEDGRTGGLEMESLKTRETRRIIYQYSRA
jgi:hypothetical protein